MKYSLILRFTVIMAIIVIGELFVYLMGHYFGITLIFDNLGFMLFNLLFFTLIISPIILYFLRLIHQTEKDYQNLINNIPEGVIVQKDNRIIDANERGSLLLGGRNPNDIIGKSIYDFIKPGDESNLLYTNLNGNQSRRGTYLEQELVTLNGSTIELETTGAPVIYKGEECILTIERDVTERNRIQREHQNVQRKYEIISNNMHDYIALLNKNGEIGYASPSCVQLVGNEINSQQKKSVLDFIHQEDRQMVEEVIKEISEKQTNEGKRVDFRLDHITNEEEIWLETEVININDGQDNEDTILFVSRNITERKALEEKLNQMAFYDELTNLPNRKMLEISMKSAISRAKRFNHQMITMFIDLDGFKEVNDSLGHKFGDELLKKVSERFMNCVREEDVVARFGGDEFVIILEESSNLEIEAIMDRIINQISLPMEIDHEEVTVTPSIGISLYPEHGESVETLLNRADHAMYFAKYKGKNNYQVYNKDLPAIQELKSNLITRLLNQFKK